MRKFIKTAAILLMLAMLTGCVDRNAVIYTEPVFHSIEPMSILEAEQKISEPLYKPLHEAKEKKADETEYTVPIKYYSANGSVTSATAAGIDIRIVWSAEWSNMTEKALIDVSVYLDHLSLRIKDPRVCTLTIGKTSVKYNTGAITETSSKKHSMLIGSNRFSAKLSKKGDTVLNMSAKWYLGGKYGGVKLDWIKADGKIILSEKYSELPASHKLNVKNILQNPELPNGCEITSLTILLNYLGFKVDKLTMTSKYLAIGEVYASDFRKKNVGDPRSRYSFGCYSPVIYDSAVKFMKVNDKNGKYAPRDLTGCGTSELYRQVADGNPVIVWITSELDTEPYILRNWVADGVHLYWKHPLHAVVISGYDLKKHTVTIADPLKGVVTIPLETFETRFMQMGSQAVIIEEKNA